MYLLIFGTIWNAVISFAMHALMFSGRGSYVNGQYMSEAEVREQPFLWIFFAVFYIIGFCLMFKGGKIVIQNVLTKFKGTDAYGVILDIHGTGVYINNRPVLVADILTVINDSQTEVFTEELGVKKYKYKIGDFLKLKYYNKDVNIVTKTQETEIPAYIFEILQKESRGFMGMSMHMGQNGYPYMPNNLHQSNFPLNQNNFNSPIEQQLKNQSVTSNQYENSHSFNNNSGRNDDEIIINGKVYKKQ